MSNPGRHARRLALAAAATAVAGFPAAGASAAPAGGAVLDVVRQDFQGRSLVYAFATRTVTEVRR
ncbi:hypothetical protein [Kineococcus glutinatus]|uniref:Uncharacterized protein n=1 Tax=Kineococcus glutinatus TaxID=1070872 RepID=A0ABP9HCL6_9ACTN